MPGEIYRASDIIDKTLFAKTDVPIYTAVPGYLATGRTLDEFKVGTVKAGNWVGRVDTWISPNPAAGRANIWWQFYPAENYAKPYYAEHKEGRYDISALREQGVLSIEEIRKIEEKKKEEENKPWYQSVIDGTIGKALPWVAFIVIGSVVVKAVISNAKNKSDGA